MPKKSSLVEKNKRSIFKSVTFRITVIISDTIITYTLTRRVDLTAGFVIFTNIASTFLYYSHERIWAHIHWGK